MPFFNCTDYGTKWLYALHQMLKTTLWIATKKTLDCNKRTLNCRTFLHTLATPVTQKRSPWFARLVPFYLKLVTQLFRVTLFLLYVICHPYQMWNISTQVECAPLCQIGCHFSHITHHFTLVTYKLSHIICHPKCETYQSRLSVLLCAKLGGTEMEPT